MGPSRYLKLVSHLHFSRRVLCGLIAAYIRLVYTTSNWEEVGDEIPHRFWCKQKPFILAFWHERLLMMPYCWNRPSRVTNMNIDMLVSSHQDGQLISCAVARLGIRTVTGSSSHGGATALRAMLKALKIGEAVGITPDGPRGPRNQVSIGIVQVAKLGGVPIVPVSFSTSRSVILKKSWDRFLIALPFSRGVFIWGQPISVPREADAIILELRRREIERALNAVTVEADRHVGKILSC